MAFFISGVRQAATRARRTRRSVLDRVPAGFLDVRLPSPSTAALRRMPPPRVTQPVRRPIRPFAPPRPITRGAPTRPASLGEAKPAADIGPTSRRALDVQLQSLSQLSAQGRIAQKRFKAEVRRARSAALRFL